MKKENKMKKNKLNIDITAIIPVRAGSRRLKNKNIRPFGGTNLLIWKIRQLKKVKEISRIIVSSDSDTMLEMARKHGVIGHKREEIFCDDISVPFGEVAKNICENIDGEHVIWSPCVCPLVEPKHYSGAINTYFEKLKKGYDSLLSVEPFKKFLWDEKGPVNYKLGKGHVISQNLPTYYFMSNGIFIAPRKKMIEWFYFHGPKPYKYELPKRACVDIDDELDLCTARAWFNKI